jgi:hypothetical protein
LIATTSDIDNNNFLKGYYSFIQPTDSSNSIVNRGTLNVADGGLLALVAPGVENSGTINARFGRVTLASGTHFIVDLYGDGLINLGVRYVYRDSDSYVPPIVQSIENSGQINAQGGTVVMNIKSAQDVLSNVVNMSGVINANSFFSQKGVIILSGDPNSTVRVAGTLNASGTGINEQAGAINITGNKIGLLDNSKIDVSSNNHGGTVFLGRIVFGAQPENGGQGSRIYMAPTASIDASSYEAGPAGQVSLWGNSSQILGTIKAQGGTFDGVGGKVTTAGTTHLEVTQAPNVSSHSGKAGTWDFISDNVEIVDKQAPPTSDQDLSVFEFSDSPTKLAASILEDALNTGAQVHVSKGYNRKLQPGGKITVNAPISFSGGGTLALESGGDVQVNESITLDSIGETSPNLFISADTDMDGEGDFNLVEGKTISSFQGRIRIRASDVNLAGTIDNPQRSIIFENSTEDTMYLGKGTGEFVLSGDELKNISGKFVNFTNSRGNIYIDGLSENDTRNIENFSVNTSFGEVSFVNNSSTFNNLSSFSYLTDVSVKTDLTIKGYGSSFYTLGKGAKFYLASGSTIRHTSYGTTTLVARDFDIQGNMQTSNLNISTYKSQSMGFGKANCGGSCEAKLDNQELKNISANRVTLFDSKEEVSIYFDGVTEEAFSSINELTLHGMPKYYKDYKQSNIFFTGDLSFLPRGKIDRNANITVDSQVDAKDIQWSVANIDFTQKGKVSGSQNVTLSTEKWAEGNEGDVTMHEASVISAPAIKISAKEDITLGLLDATANPTRSPHVTLSSKNGSILDGDQDGKLDINAGEGYLKVSTPNNFGTNENPIEVIAGNADFSDVAGAVGTKLSSENGINIFKNANFSESTSIDADTNRDGEGTFKVFSQATVSTANNPLSITAGEVVLQGKLDSGTAKTAITLTQKSNTGIGNSNCNGPCGSSISNNELQQITASKLEITTTGQTFVNGVSEQSASKSNLNTIKSENNIVIAESSSSFKNILIETSGNINVEASVSAQSELSLNATNVAFSSQGKATAATVNVNAKENQLAQGGSLTQAPQSSINGNNVNLTTDQNIVLAKVNVFPEAEKIGSVNLTSNKGDILNGLDTGININASQSNLNVKKANNVGSQNKAIEVLARKLNIEDPTKFTLVHIINRINENNAEKTVFGFGASAEVINLQPSSPFPNDPTNGGAFIVDPLGLLGPQDGAFSTIGLP